MDKCSVCGRPIFLLEVGTWTQFDEYDVYDGWWVHRTERNSAGSPSLGIHRRRPKYDHDAELAESER